MEMSNSPTPIDVMRKLLIGKVNAKSKAVSA
jgi:hypothetical protein